MNKNKILLIGVGCALCLSGFIIATNYEDISNVVNSYKSTTNGTYTRKHLEVVIQEAKKNANEDSSQASGSEYIAVPVPDDLSPESIIAWVDKLNICKERKDLIKNACGQAGKASYAIAGHGNWSADNLAGRSIDCSGFVAWSYNSIGFNAFGGCNTSGIPDHYVRTMKALPGDLGNITVEARRAFKPAANYGHAGIYLGERADGVSIYIEAGSGAVPKIQPHADLDKGDKLMHPDMAALDTTYYASAGSSGGSSGIAGEFTLKDPKGCKMPDTVFRRVNATSNRKEKLIVLDPGHGPADVKTRVPDFSVGAYYSVRGTPYGGETEEQFTLRTALTLQDKLVAQGFDVIVTRQTEDDIVPNKLRGVMANEVNADHMICIHWNGGGGHGPCIVIPSDYNSRSWHTQTESMWAAIGPKLASHIGDSVRSPYVNDVALFGVVSVPVTYIEVGFADSSDINKLAGDANREAIAQAICDGVVEYYK